MYDGKNQPRNINCNEEELLSLLMIVGIACHRDFFQLVSQKLKHFLDIGKRNSISFQVNVSVACGVPLIYL
jgi:hypothetical protein